MAGATDVKQLLLQVDASVELLRRNLTAGQAQVDRFTAETQRRLDAADRRFGEFGRPLAGLRTSIDATRREIATIGTSVERTESRIRAAAGGIKAALLGSASGLAAAFSVDRIKEYADGYTRYTNQLKVAGLEGAVLAKTQNDLYAVAQRNGVELEAVGTLYGKASAAAKELGGSNADLLRFTSGVSAALRVQGGSAEAASGALQQLGQLLGSSRVQAEEFNSVADGARPILQAVANNLDGAGGSISKLKSLVNDGKVSNTDFFRAFLKGSTDLEAQAAKANLTIAASFTILNNALGKYIGETDAGLSATARVSSAIISLSQNLDTLIPALAIVATGFATRFVAGPVAAVAAEVLLLTKALDAEKLVLIGGRVAAAQKADFTAAAARTEVASIEATIAARKQDQAAIAQTLALIEAQRAESLKAAEQQAFNARLNFGLGRAVTSADAARVNADLKAQLTTKRALAVVDAELIELNNALAVAQGRATAAETASTAAAAELTIASRASAAASQLFAAGLTLIGGSVAGGAAVLAIGALVGAILLYRDASQQADDRNRATAESMQHAAQASRKLNVDLLAVANSGSAAASGIALAGGAANSATGKMLTFAGAVGEAAAKLQVLAQARRREEILNFARQSADAEHQANLAAQRINARSRARQANRGFQSLADATANADDAALVVQYRGMQASAYRAMQAAARRPLESRISESDRNGGRDIEGELARVTRDLVVARKRGIRSQVEALEAQKFELTQYKDYRKKGLSPQAAQEAASRDAGAFRSASAGAQGDLDARTARRAAATADREAAAARRRQAAQVRDAASDERAYSAAERQANNQIAAARADLTNSAVERAAIEKARIEAERVNRNNEIAQQAKQGGLGDGVQAQTRALELQRLNDQRAALETEVVTAREKQREADEALAIAQADRGNQVDLLGKETELVTTAAQRRDLELRILALQYDEERARLDGVIASRDTTEAEKEIARRRRAILDELQAADEKGVERKNEGPLDQYRRRLREGATDMNTALQGVAVNGLEQLENGLIGIVNGTESVSSAFKRMAASIISDLARIAIEKAIVSAIGGGGFFGLSTGGKIEGFAAGGRISGPGTGTSDSILALVDGRKPLMVSNGESIVTAEATARWWPIIDAMNRGTLQKLATGGMVGRPPAATISTPTVPSLAAMAAGGVGGLVTVRLALSEDLHATIDNRAAGVAVQVVRATAPEIVDAASAQTMTILQRPNL
ncbi:hypothetical protein GCM10022253_19430 [Sphingomonas endophytica]|uniref:tape measure protein n=1 Tax=Sphingomonas endophytica TaxID=869719 RepID=UPI0031D5FFC0